MTMMDLGEFFLESELTIRRPTQEGAWSSGQESLPIFNRVAEVFNKQVLYLVHGFSLSRSEAVLISGRQRVVGSFEGAAKGFIIGESGSGGRLGDVEPLF